VVYYLRLSSYIGSFVFMLLNKVPCRIIERQECVLSDKKRIWSAWPEADIPLLNAIDDLYNEGISASNNWYQFLPDCRALSYPHIQGFDQYLLIVLTAAESTENATSNKMENTQSRLLQWALSTLRGLRTLERYHELWNRDLLSVFRHFKSWVLLKLHWSLPLIVFPPS